MHSVYMESVKCPLLNAKQYTDRLWDNSHNGALELGILNSCYFQQDKDPKHTAYITKLCLPYNVKTWLQMPPQLAEYVLDIKIRKKKNYNKSELKQILREKGLQIRSNICHKLSQSMPRWLQAVTEAKCMHTKY